MANNYRKRCSISLVSRRVETNPQWDITWHPIKRLKFQIKNNNNSLQGCWENSASGSVNIKDILEQNLAAPHSIKRSYHVTQQFHLAVHQREVKTRTYKTLCTNTHRTIIYKRQKVEITRMTMKRWLGKHMVVYSYNGTVFSDKNEWSVDTLHRWALKILCS